MSRNEFDALIQTVYEHGCYSKVGCDAIDELVEGGEPALDAWLESVIPETSLHPRDLGDTVSGVYWEFAKRNPDAVIDRRDEIGNFQTYWSLGAAKGRRSIEVLIEGLNSKDQYDRWAAAESLVRRRSKRALPALIAALNDRSSMVKFTIVEGMRRNRSFRSPDALPALRRIIGNKSIQKHSPGTWKTATEVVRMIEEES